MLTLTTLSSGNYFNLFSSSFFAPLLGPINIYGKPTPNSGGTRVIAKPGIISTGDYVLGDSSCFHESIHGHLISLSSQSAPSPVGHGLTRITVPTGLTKVVDFSHYCELNRVVDTGIRREISDGTGYRSIALWEEEEFVSLQYTYAPDSTVPSGINILRFRAYLHAWIRCTSAKVSIVQAKDFALSLEALRVKYPPIYGTGGSLIRFVGYTADLQAPSIDDRTLVKTMMALHPSPMSVAGVIPNVWGDLAQDCVESANQVDINSLEFVRDLARIKEMLPPIPRGKKGILTKKYVASLYLWWQYGISAFCRDVQSLHSSAMSQLTTDHIGPKSAFRTLRAGTVDTFLDPAGDIIRDYRYKVRYSRYPQAILQVIEGLHSVGVYPTLANSWDFVPFSFAVDWLIPISTLLERLDFYSSYQYFDIWGVTKSEKYAQSWTINGLSVYSLRLSGSLVRTSYRRYVQRTLDSPTIRLDAPKAFSNYGEAAALIIQNIRR